jgi:hypothetical protein
VSEGLGLHLLCSTPFNHVSQSGNTIRLYFHPSLIRPLSANSPALTRSEIAEVMAVCMLKALDEIPDHVQALDVSIAGPIAFCCHQRDTGLALIAAGLTR